MEVEFVRKRINDQGGVGWLKNVGPNELFGYLQQQYSGGGRVETVIQPDNCGWMLYFSDVGIHQKRVVGYYYQTSNYLLAFSGKLIYQSFFGWYLVTETDYATDLVKMKEFASMALKIIKGV
ncbi:MAG: hypothetical protein PHX84_03635 [Candidatus Shapirobacteria bacterium]|jgi:hypothetical protein|nr:hypothetical protein [Candidatus Shapirobacteria bacterium]